MMSKGPAVKMVAFLSRRSDFSHAQFEQYYEDNHTPLALRALPRISKYVRNYIEPGAEFNNRPGGAPCDVVTEVWWDTEEDYQYCQKACATSELFKELQVDETKFMDTGAIRICLVKERSSEIA